MITLMNDTSCPCGADKPYADCCGRFHSGSALAPTAEALMRSRYSAYVLDQLDYLLATWHRSTRPTALSPNEPGLRWLELEIKSHVQQDEGHATVAFVARSKLGGRAHRLAEISRFVRGEKTGRWFYLDGEID